MPIRVTSGEAGGSPEDPWVGFSRGPQMDTLGSGGKEAIAIELGEARWG